MAGYAAAKGVAETDPLVQPDYSRIPQPWFDSAAAKAATRTIEYERTLVLDDDGNLVMQAVVDAGLSADRLAFCRDYGITQVPVLDKLKVLKSVAATANVGYDVANSAPDAWVRVTPLPVPLRELGPNEILLRSPLPGQEQVAVVVDMAEYRKMYAPVGAAASAPTVAVDLSAVMTKLAAIESTLQQILKSL